MRLVKLSQTSDEVVSELRKDQLNEAGKFLVLDLAREANFDADFTVLMVDDHLKSKEIIEKFAAGFENAGVVLFDAHLDSLNNEDVVPFLSRFIDKSNIIIVGAREWSKDEYFFVKNSNIKVYSMKEIGFEGKETVCDAVMSVAKDFGALYVSIDADVLDQETGGLSVRELLYFLQRLKKLRNFKAADLAEFKDVKLAAKVTRELS